MDVEGTFDNTITLLVHYELTHTDDDTAAWSDNLFSQVELSVGEVFAGLERIKRLQREAVSDNLRQLLDALDRSIAR